MIFSLFLSVFEQEKSPAAPFYGKISGSAPAVYVNIECIRGLRPLLPTAANQSGLPVDVVYI